MDNTQHENKGVTVGEALVNLLADYGVELVFGIPGTHSIELYRGLESGRVRHISPRHEQGGGFMADGYARVSGKPGVCFVITGPGVTNITTPMGEAYMDSVPMLVISPVNVPDPKHVNRGRLHEITNQSAVTAPLTAMSVTIEDPDQIPRVIEQAFNVFSSQRPRPVHINIPLPIFPKRLSGFWEKSPLAEPLRASNTEIDNAIEKINDADKPVIIAGGGTTKAASALLSLAEKIHCPVLTTVAGRGTMNPEHPLTVGAQLRTPHVQRLLEEADLGIFVGTEFAQTDHWNDDLKLPEQQIWINLCDHALEQNDQALTIKADSGGTMERIAQRLSKPKENTIKLVNQRCKDIRALHQSSMTEKETLHWSVLSDIMNVIDPETTIVSDMTQLAYTAVDYLPMSRPNQWLHPTGYGTLGYALPAAIGATLAKEGSSSLVIVGDAGLQYTLQEMTLASELGLNVVILLWNNNALQQICDDMDNSNIQRTGIFQSNPDFIALAKSCHWEAYITKKEDLSKELPMECPTRENSGIDSSSIKSAKKSTNPPIRSKGGALFSEYPGKLVAMTSWV
ncbi:MAG: 5-guanidino-2-oxopentanoate decarboxylase [Gammaproteobacteria bacterium]|nr:5-guanidino-2-oxopentanoate decarboxylase [Gammaproteobacteria bacterium]